MATSTQKSRQVQWRKYFEFCDQYHLTPLPANPHQICRFLVFLTSTLKYSPINSYLSGVILLHKMYGYAHEFRLDFRVTLTLQGLRRVLGDTSCCKSPLLPVDLHAMYKLVNLSSDFEQAVWACVILAFRTLLRKSNLIPSADQSQHCVKRKDISCTNWGLLVHIESSKTVQFKQRTLEIPVVIAPSYGLCAVSQLREHFRRTPSAKKGQHLFMVAKKGIMKPLNYADALLQLKDWGSRECHSKDIGFHSLRRGAATHMSTLGIKLEDIKAAEDWASLAVLIYLTTPLSHKIKVDNIVAGSLL